MSSLVAAPQFPRDPGSDAIARPHLLQKMRYIPCSCDAAGNSYGENVLIRLEPVKLPPVFTANRYAPS